MESGVHEFLLKPVSSKALADRLLAVLKPRKLVRRGDYYGPEPRKPQQFLKPGDKVVILN
jgi:hypothetical protein